jgi:hypothetical protein
VLPIEVVGGTLILECLGAAVTFVSERDDGLPQEVLVEIPPRPRPILPADLAAVYERALSGRGLPSYAEFKGSISYELSGYHLHLRLKQESVGFVIAGPAPVSFLAPKRVAAVYTGLLSGYVS